MGVCWVEGRVYWVVYLHGISSFLIHRRAVPQANGNSREQGIERKREQRRARKGREKKEKGREEGLVE